MNLPVIEVPANASRYFDSFNQSMQQPLGKIKITYNKEDNFYYNSLFDSSLNLYDSYYYTKDSSQLVNSLHVFYPLIKKYQLLNIVDIGCGQGEYVRSLNELNVSAVGYDPTLKETSSNLRKEYFDPENAEIIEQTFVMRCVLPHIANPFLYINSLLLRSTESKIYIEFQRLEWILENQNWNSISHEHVNLFRIEDFERRYNVIESGVFSGGEWGYVLFSRTKKYNSIIERSNDFIWDDKFRKLFDYRGQQLAQLIGRSKPFLIYGAAGKGIIFSHAYKSNGGGEIFCIDSDQGRQGKYLECSGVLVISPIDALRNFDPNTLILVMNKNHINAVNENFGNRLMISSLSNYLG